MAFGEDTKQRVLFELDEDHRKASRGMRQYQGTVSKATGAIRANLGKIAAGVAAITGALKLASASMETFETNTRLAGSLADPDGVLGKLRQSTRGLIDDTSLLRIASAGLTGEFQLTEDQVAAVSRSLLVFRKEGVELGEAQSKLIKILREGKIAGFQDLGIEIERTGDKTEEFSIATQQAIDKSREFTDAQLEMAGDDVRQARTTLENFWDTTQHQIGEATFALVGFISEMVGLSEATIQAREAFLQLRAVQIGADVRGQLRDISEGVKERAQQRGIAGLEAVGVGSGLSREQLEALGGVLLTGRQVQLQAAAAVGENERRRAEAAAQRRAAGGGGGGGQRVIPPPPVNVTPGSPLFAEGGLLQGPQGLGGGQIPTAEAPGFAERTGLDVEGMGDFADEAQRAADAFTSFDEQVISEKNAVISESFRTMGGIVAQTTIEMIEGQESLAKGFEMMTGRIVRAIGVQLIQRGTASLAEAAILAFTPGGQANAAGLAATGGVALATGAGILAVSKELGFGESGGGGEQPSAAGGGTAPSVSGLGRPTGGGGEGGQNVTVVLGSEWHAMTPTEQNHEWGRFQNALRSGELQTNTTAFG